METHRILLDPDDMTPEERLDALAEVLAEGLLYLDQNGLLNSDEDSYPSQSLSEKHLPIMPLTSVGKEGNPSSQDNGAHKENHGNR